LRESILAIPLADFLFELFFQTEMIPVLAAVKYQKTRRLGNLQYILEQVLSGKIQSPFELLHALDEKLAPERTEEPSFIPPEGGAVTVTTIHGAKGLAWKHVVVASMPTDRHSRRGKVISYDHQNLAAFNLGVSMDVSSRNTMKSPYWPEINKINEAREKAELRRLLYVAVTRPRDSLVVFVKPDVKPGNSDGAILWQSLQSAMAVDPGCCEMEEMIPTKQLSASGFVRLEVKTGKEIPVSDEGVLFEIDPEPEGWQSRGAAIGDYVHEVMEKIDFSSPEEWFTDNQDYLKRIYGDDYQEIKELSLRFFRMKLPFNLEKSEILGREYPYQVKTSRGLKKRYIDLLLRENGKLTVVDYKTDSFGESSADDVAAGYLKTQKYYIRDISEIYGTEACGYLVFLREGIVFPVLPD
jgi:ATP-dependent exoDNAse (exonuclease V) beta subunit